MIKIGMLYVVLNQEERIPRSVGKSLFFSFSKCVYFLNIGIVCLESKDQKGNILVIPLVHLSSKQFKVQEKLVFSKKNNSQLSDSNGPFRDTIRIHQLENEGFNVYSISCMDSRSSGYYSDKHIEASITETDSKSRSLTKILQDRINVDHRPFFSLISLDYIRMPTNYIRLCFPEHFWYKILVELYEYGFISLSTPIYVSNFEDLEGILIKAQSRVKAKGFQFRIESCEVNENPLFRATDRVTAILESISDPNTNAAYMQSRKARKLFAHMFRIFLQEGMMVGRMIIGVARSSASAKCQQIQQ